MKTTMLAAVLVLAACAAQSASTVPVRGKDADMALLAGKWAGDYEGSGTGRRGTIHFDLALGYHTAEGQVVMETGEPLQIKFVNVGEGQVSGRIAPYTDPDCNCTVETEFTGQLQGDSMSGTFVTSGSGVPERTGRWTAVRSDR